jgi:hypothetical protein
MRFTTVLQEGLKGKLGSLLYLNATHIKTTQQYYILMANPVNFKEFPNVKLSYETFVHKKVDESDVTVVIPQGKKCYAWLRNGQCHFVFHNQNADKQLALLKSFSFSTDGINNSILYGTLFKESYFAVQDILFHRGKITFTQDRTLENLLKLCTTTFASLFEEGFKKNKEAMFGVPIMYEGAVLVNQNEIPYLVESVQYRYFSKTLIHKLQIRSGNNNGASQGSTTNKNSNNNNNNTNNKSTPEKTQTQVKRRVFTVVADLQNDIYHLQDVNNLYMHEKLIAYIPDYKTSVLMNQLFRKIKENVNLDALEESDSEEEFENDKIDKFVQLNVQKNMLCELHPKFKKWIPIKVI